MNQCIVSSLAVLCCTTVSAHAQPRDATNSLARARSTFTASDSDRDAKISVRELEANALKIELSLFTSIDHDKDGFWSRDEFVVYYKQLLKSAGQRAADDLEQDVARILSVRKAQEVERAEKLALAARKAANSGLEVVGKPGEKARAESPAKPTEPVADIDARLQRALDELEKKAAARGATREDFGAVRDLYAARAKASQSGAGAVPAGDPAQAEIAARFQRALDELEKNALAGKWSREEFTQVRDMMAHRARAAASDPLRAPAREKPVADPVVTQESVAVRFENALAALEQKAAGRGATREDFQRVKELLVARAREAWSKAEPKGDAAAEQAYGARIEQLYKEFEKAAAGTASADAALSLRKALENPAATDVKVGGPADQRRNAADGKRDVASPSGTRDSSKPATATGAPNANGAEGSRKSGADGGQREVPKDGAKPEAPAAARARAAGAAKPATPPDSKPPQPIGPAKEREKPKEKEAEKPAPTPPQNRGGG